MCAKLELSTASRAATDRDASQVGLELRARARADSRALAHTFGPRAGMGDIIDVRSGLSDPHAYGRTVALVTFSSGARVVYKPRSLRVDVAFGIFLDWLSAGAPTLPPLKAVRTLDCGAYGWAEYVAPAPCVDRDALTRYYERAGALLAVAYVLRVGDLHDENVIAAGEHPMLIDLEAALTPVLTQARAHGDADDSCVLETGFLPIRCLAADGRGFVTGGLTAAPPAAAACRTTSADGVSPSSPHLPTCGTPESHLTSVEIGAVICRGFDRAYRAMQASAGELLARGGPLAAFGRASTRMVLRATSVYGVLLRRLTYARFVTDPAARAAEIGRLHLPFRDRPEWAAMAPAFASEVAAIERADVPRFELLAGGTALRADGRVVVPHYAALSGLAAVRRRIRALNPTDRVRQLAYARVALAADTHRQAYARAPNALSARTRGDDRTGQEEAMDAAAGPEITSDDALDEASSLGMLLAQIATYGRMGEVRWHARDVASGAPQLTTLDTSLGHGQAGVALALAALGHMGRMPDAVSWDELSAGALAPVRAALARARRVGRLGGGGFATGVGGIAYALCGASRWLTDPTLVGTAADAVAASTECAATQYAAAGDRVFGGAAGQLLGAVAVHAATGDARVLARAATLVGRVMESARAGGLSTADGRAARRHGLAWSDGNEPAGAGFGAAGCGLAMARLAARTELPRHVADTESLLDATAERLQSTARAAAADGTSTPLALGAWCDGVIGAGIVLAAGLSTELGADAARARWAEALGVVAAAAVHGCTNVAAREPYTLCCGTFGRVELLLAAAAALRAPRYAAAARQLAFVAVLRARRRLAYHPTPHLEPFAPALFTGLAGVAYTLLRVAAPDRIPSVLAAATLA